jgi:hypothetical protein
MNGGIALSTSTLPTSPTNGQTVKPVKKVPASSSVAEHEARPFAVSTAPLAGRVLIIELWLASDGNPMHNVYTGLGLRSSLIRHYRRTEYRTGAHRYGPDPDLTERGFRLDDVEERMEIVFLCADGWLCGDIEARNVYHHDDRIFRLVDADWPRDQDAEKLAPLIAGFERDLLARRRHREQRATERN